MRLAIGLLVALLVAPAGFGQGLENKSTKGTGDDSRLKWIPPTATFANAPSSPPIGAVYVFTDAASLGNCSGGGTAKATCQWTGSSWAPTGGGNGTTRPSNTVALVGDSITGQNSPAYFGSVYGLNADGYWNWANAMLGSAFNVVAYAGVSGNNTTQMLARLNTDVIAYHPGWCVVEGGVNDILNGLTSATSIANLTAIYNALNAAGIKTIMLTVTPTTSVGSDARQFAINSWMKSFAATNPNLIVVDAAAAMIDANSGTVAPLPNATLDGVHFASLAGYLVGKAIATALAGAVPPTPAIISNNDPSTLVVNGLQIGTAGSTGSGASGSVSNSWTLTGYAGATCIGSKGTRGDGLGAVQTITMTGTSANSYCELKQTITGWTGTDTLQVQAEILNGSTIGKMVTAQLVFHAGSDHVHTTLWQDNGTTVLTNTTPDMVLKNVPQSVWGGTTSIDVSIWIYGTSGTVNIGRVEVHKI